MFPTRIINCKFLLIIVDCYVLEGNELDIQVSFRFPKRVLLAFKRSMKLMRVVFNIKC